MDTTKKDGATQKATDDELTTSDLESVAGGEYYYGWSRYHCDAQGNVQGGDDPDAPGWRYDSDLEKCVPA